MEPFASRGEVKNKKNRNKIKSWKTTLKKPSVWKKLFAISDDDSRGDDKNRLVHTPHYPLTNALGKGEKIARPFGCKKKKERKWPSD